MACISGTVTNTGTNAIQNVPANSGHEMTIGIQCDMHLPDVPVENKARETFQDKMR